MTISSGHNDNGTHTIGETANPFLGRTALANAKMPKTAHRLSLCPPRLTMISPLCDSQRLLSLCVTALRRNVETASGKATVRRKIIQDELEEDVEENKKKSIQKMYEGEAVEHKTSIFHFMATKIQWRCVRECLCVRVCVRLRERARASERKCECDFPLTQ